VDGRDKPGHDELIDTASHHVMPGFMPGIHVFASLQQASRDRIHRTNDLRA